MAACWCKSGFVLVFWNRQQRRPSPTFTQGAELVCNNRLVSSLNNMYIYFKIPGLCQESSYNHKFSQEMNLARYSVPSLFPFAFCHLYRCKYRQFETSSCRFAFCSLFSPAGEAATSKWFQASVKSHDVVPPGRRAVGWVQNRQQFRQRLT